MFARRDFLPGSVAVVTGAGSGIGATVAAALIQRGLAVALLDRDVAALAETVARCAPGQTLAVPTDITDPEAVAAAFAAATEQLGPVRHVVAAAGVLRPAPLTEIDPLDWAISWQVNVGGVLHVLQESARRLPEGGSVVVVSSNAAVVPRIGMASYAASKAAAAALTRVAGLELAEHGIRCNLVAPGTTATPMLAALWPDPAAAEAQALAGEPAKHRLGIPLGRIADPEDIADSVLYLLSDQARHITLQQLVVDGGATL
ncbi:SDR family oxidoreductase [Nocardioides sp. Bht2]|uniref:SDR family oxidoreductase n=1 Tax=Nocardioides sp. Bht2 TaxID=3392297 RepID=UPI0039B621B9